ncbi:MarR family winged helix-turn-helix transcriptional regulator [Lacticaseibacillus manihotivorans]|uniref:MarR family winged helix-turn-helix transcriptional regulator n=1 Tax=Lacticaseibacillus manihotivorans TaxID=88233 RepID=UPI000B07C387|nr:MarR family winged helix-turn-helix transcriptional regulator [Lacticaseibacillus manihotivorans]
MLDIIRDIGAITRTIQIRSNAEFRPLDLDNNRFIYLIRVCEQPGMFLGALADSIQIDRTTAFRTVKKLVADGCYAWNLMTQINACAVFIQRPKLKPYIQSYMPSSWRNLSICWRN